MNSSERYSGNKEFKRKLETLIRSKNIEEILGRVVTFISPLRTKNIDISAEIKIESVF